MKVYLEGFEKHHETGGVLHQKNTVNLFTYTVMPYTSRMHYILHTLLFYFITRPILFGNKCRDIQKNKAQVYSLSKKTIRYLQDIVSGSWSPSLLVVDRAAASSAASASGSTCAQQVLLPGLRLCGCMERAGLPGSSVPSLGVRLLLSRVSWQSWGSRHHRPNSFSPSDPREVTCSESTVNNKEKGKVEVNQRHTGSHWRVISKCHELNHQYTPTESQFLQCHVAFANM